MKSAKDAYGLPEGCLWFFENMLMIFKIISVFLETRFHPCSVFLEKYNIPCRFRANIIFLERGKSMFRLSAVH